MCPKETGNEVKKGPQTWKNQARFLIVHQSLKVLEQRRWSALSSSPPIAPTLEDVKEERKAF